MSDFEYESDDCDSDSIVYDSDEESGMPKKAFHIQIPDDFDPNSIPTNGEEYLQHVMYERLTKCEELKTSDIRQEEFQKNVNFGYVEIPTVAPPDKQYLPTAEWKKEKLEEFLKLRESLEDKYDSDDWISGFKQSEFVHMFRIQPPKLSYIIKVHQNTKIKMLSVISSYLDNYSKELNPNVGAWILAILSLLVMPMMPKHYNVVRELAKKCAAIRLRLPEKAPKEWYIPYNYFVCIVSTFFRQADLADPV